MTLRRQLSIVVTLIVASGLVGCGGGAQANPDLTEEDAKAIAQAGENRIVAAIPVELVSSVDQHPTGALLSCPGDHDYVWGGGTDVTLNSSDVAAVIDSIVDVGSQPGWRGRQETSAAGDPRAVLYGPDGDSYVVDGLADRREVSIASGSPCFHLPDGEYPSSF